MVTTSGDFTSVYLASIMAFNLTLTVVMCFLGFIKFWKSRGYFHLCMSVACTLFLIIDIWYFYLFFNDLSPTVPFHRARVFIPLISGGLLACLGIERFQVFSKAGLAPWYPSLLRYFMIVLTLTMLALGTGLLSYSYSQWNLAPSQQTNWSKWVCAVTMLYFLIVDFSLSIMSFFLVVKLRFQTYQISNEKNNPKFMYTLRKRILICIALLLSMFIFSLTGTIIFSLLRNILCTFEI
ncbi:hypothetical protein HMI54_010335 [Coelomomyces lativittatus]|nr:hypothetical protein HMI54_010335 [Coelomomyces lativittatus]